MKTNRCLTRSPSPAFSRSPSPSPESRSYHVYCKSVAFDCLKGGSVAILSKFALINLGLTNTKISLVLGVMMIFALKNRA